MAVTAAEDTTLGNAKSTELTLPEADYGAEVKAMVAVLAQFRNLIGNLEGLLFNLQVYSHRIPDRPKLEVTAVMDAGDFIEHTPSRLIRGYGICEGKEQDITHVHSPADKQKTTDTSS